MRSGRDVGSVKPELKNGKEKMTGRRSRATRLEMAGRASVVETGWSLLLRRVRRCILFWDWCLSESSTSRFFFRPSEGGVRSATAAMETGITGTHN